MKNGKIILEPFKPVTVKIDREIIKEILEEEGKNGWEESCFNL